MKLINRWFLFGIAALWSVNGLAQPANNNGGAYGAFDEQQQARDLTGKRGQQQVDPFTGSFGYSIPIACAPARNGSEPALALVYSSGADNGWCGMGWKLDIGRIERNTKDGFPIQFTSASIPAPATAYDDTKGFLLNLFGKEYKLYSVATNGSVVEYRAETETEFLRCFLDTSSNNKWTVYDKSGNTYYFGQSSNSRVANPKWTSGSSSSTFQWALDQVDTPTGDRTTVSYATYNNPEGVAEQTIFPTTITYNSHFSVNGYGAPYTGLHTISFGTELRPDRRVSYRYGFRTEQNRLLTNIVCEVNSQPVWRYAIGYTTSLATGRSLLSSVTVYGSDNTTALPTQTFNYQQNTNGVSFGPTMIWTNMILSDLSGSGGTDPYVTQITGAGSTIADLFDINGDGLPDRVSWDATTPNTYQVQFNNGAGGFGPRYTFGPSSSAGGTTASDSNPIPDGGYYSALNSGYTRIRDLNGDGLPDRICDWWKHFVYYTTYPYTNFAVQLNNGNGFGSAFLWPVATNDLASDPSTYMSLIESGPTQPYVGLIDINGDGLPDRVMALYNQSETYFKVQFNTGTNFSPVKYFGPYRSQNYTNSVSGIPWSGVNTPYAEMVDMNGDGLPDRVMLPMNPSSVPSPMVYGNANFNYFAVEYNDGYGFESTNTSTSVPGAYDRWPGVVLQSRAAPDDYDQIQNLPVVGLYDLNGDGLPDRVMLDETAFAQGKAQWLVYLNNGRGFNTNAIKVPIDAQGQTNDLGWCGVSFADANAYNSVVTTLIDINGDGLLDRVMKVYDNGNGNADTYSNYFLVQLNQGPFPDLLTNVNNGIGGIIAVTYKPSTAYDNRRDPTVSNSGSACPFPMQTVSTVTASDGINPAQTTTYAYAGGYYDGPRREFHGFAVVTNTDPTLRYTVTYFHTGGGRNYASLGEYQDTNSTTGLGNFAKMGMAYRVETYGNDNNLYHVTVNQVDQTSLGNGRYFPFTTLSFDCDYPSGSTSTPKVTATDYNYDSSNGNLTNKLEYGMVTNFNPASVGSFTFSDSDSTDNRNYNSHFTAIGTYIVDHPDKVTLADGSNNTIKETDYSYNAGGTLATKLTRISSGYYATNSYANYTAYGLVGTTTDPVGVQTAITYDSTYNIYPATTIVGGSFTNSTSYDSRCGALALSTSPSGLTVSNSFDTFCRPTEIDLIPIGGGSAVWQKKISYPSTLTAIVSGAAVNYVDVVANDGLSGGVESRTYIDGFERPVQTRTQGENVNSYRVVSTAYDGRGNAFVTTWPVFGTSITFVKPTSGQTASWIGYDPLGRVAINCATNVTFNSSGAATGETSLSGDTGSPLGARTWSYVNGTDPWWVISTDEDGQVRKYGLDAFGRTNQIQEVDGGSTYTTTLKYDLADNLTNIVNANGENLYWAFNDAGGLVAMADPYLGQWTYQRDYANRLRIQTDGRGDVIQLSYINPATSQQDPLGRVQTKAIYGTNYVTHTLTLYSTVTNLYDSNGGDSAYTVYPGLLYKTIDSQGWEKTGYDSRARTIKTTRYLNINSNAYTTSYTLDDGNNTTAIAYPNSGPTVNYSYWHGGSINNVSLNGTSYNYYTAAASAFDEFEHVTGFSYGSSLATTRTYYSNSKRLESITAGSVFSRNFTYSAGDDILTLSGTGLSSITVTYANLHRIKSYTGLASNYAYDPTGNITNNGEGGGSTYSYANPRKQAVRTAFGYTNLYDLCGNMMVRHGGLTNSQALTYDPENRLSVIAQAGVFSAEFSYAADGARLWKRIDQNPTNIQVWIGNLYEEKAGKILYHVFAGSEQVCTFETNSYLMNGSDSTKVGYYYHQDNLNSSSVLSDHLGTQIEVNSYYPFGRTNTANPQAGFQVSRRFTGQVFDAESGLYYYNARYYDPELGRFIQPDTDIPDLSDPQSYNRYSYCRNDPLTYNDPTGHAPLLFDSEAWGQLLSPITSRAHNFFLGGSYPVNNERAMLAREGIQQWTPLTDANGNKLGNPATAVVGAGANALVQAGMMVGPMGEEKAGALAVKEGEEAVAKVLTLDGDKYPVSAANLEEAGAVNKPLTVNRADASANRADALQGLQKVPGHDLDEAPPAMFRQPGDSAVVRPTPPADNRGAGASLGNQARGVPDGGKVVIQIQRKDSQ